MGKALLRAAEDDIKQSGANGLVTWGLIIPVFMQASWFKKNGYKVADKSGIMRLLWKPFNENAVSPLFRKPVKKPGKGIDKVNLTLLRNGWCQSMNITCERAKRAALDFPGKIELYEFDTTNSNTLNEWGINDAVYIDGKEVMTGPPITYERIRRKIEKRVKKYSNL
jgi:hypothetical protein